MTGVSRVAGDSWEDVKSCCPFCRTPSANTKAEVNKRSEKRVELGDVAGIFSMACKYKSGYLDVQVDKKKAMKMFFQLVELGDGDSDTFALRGAYEHLGEAYMTGENFVKKDMKKALYCFEMSASMGDAQSRHIIGCLNGIRKGDMKTAVKHFMVGAMAGSVNCLREIQQGFNLGFVTKEESEKALQGFHKSFDSMRSDQRDKAINSLAIATALKHPSAIRGGYDKVNFERDESDDGFMKSLGNVPEQACAYCYKGGDDLKKCGACKSTQYCCAQCQRVHRPAHKYDCKLCVSEMLDEKLFKEPPKKVCQMCLLRLPLGDVYCAAG